MMLSKDNIPKHIAIIMDGNGRWAKERGLPRSAGHHQGVERVREIVKAAAEIGVSAITFFAFSTENWSRPKQEVSILLRYLSSFLNREIKELHKNNIRFKVIGREEPVPKSLLNRLRQAEDKTRDNTGMTVVLAMNYGSRQEIVDAVKEFSERLLKGQVDIQDLNVENFSDYLYTRGLPEPDLLIRTSAQKRLSNFLLWQLSYAELYFPKKYWPEFRREDLEKAIKVYQKRERRFGGA
ncbi:MAG: isoprenyl transferase [Candidatus Omnitrophica bacterium]|nr:isoprenyl transferase [Candidatus Omnitrophota bacterium]